MRLEGVQNTHVMPGSKPDYEGRVPAAAEEAVEAEGEGKVEGGEAGAKKPFWRKVTNVKGMKVSHTSSSLGYTTTHEMMFSCILFKVCGVQCRLISCLPTLLLLSSEKPTIYMASSYMEEVL